MSCEFCKAFELWKTFEKSNKKNYAKQNLTWRFEITTAIVVHSWIKEKRTKRQAGRVTDFRNEGLGFKLRFCPECGKELRGTRGR